jgi:hypothetical protein
MTATSIRIQVDPETARAYREASDAERRKLDLLLQLRLREATQQPERLEDVMREISRNAQSLGLTEGEFKGLLRDE